MAEWRVAGAGFAGDDSGAGGGNRVISAIKYAKRADSVWLLRYNARQTTIPFSGGFPCGTMRRLTLIIITTLIMPTTLLQITAGGWSIRSLAESSTASFTAPSSGCSAA
ncbi:protein of unknown function [Acidithiobacillus ferrivorans]|uniref:Uncharacterized protein n=1 Tax=Acidithiobacillus ferrivorans TaxID=160808 RepID=A0A060UPC9_9PROT|nr:hypothetical protein AFERRI_400233 [Acidithiobacillus ferrivorans]SMH64479.1 protein of unknown function [Acidithiobacillus ferrivorans]